MKNLKQRGLKENIAPEKQSEFRKVGFSFEVFVSRPK